MNPFQNKIVQIVIILIIVSSIVYCLWPQHKESFGDHNAVPVNRESSILSRGSNPVYYNNHDNPRIYSEINSNRVPNGDNGNGDNGNDDNGNDDNGNGNGNNDELKDYTLLDEDLQKFTLSNNICSPSCCSEQYQLQFKVKSDNDVCIDKDKYVITNLTCMNTTGRSESGTGGNAGCMCVTKEQQEYYESRGNNA